MITLFLKIHEMEVQGVVFKPCVVFLEQHTPKAQLTLSTELKQAIHERNILTAKTKKKFLTALDEINLNQNDANDDDVAAVIKRNERKNLILQEILESEVKYLKQLEVVMNYFIKPIRRQCVLNEKEIDVIFGNIKTIYEINGALLKELKCDLSNVTGAFLNMAPFFKLYSVYACDYNKAIETLEVN